MAKRSQQQLEQLYYRHVDTVYRVCYSYMKNPAETEDAVQDTFIKLMRKDPHLVDPRHEKAWLIRTAGNVCKDTLRRHRRRDTPLEDDLPIPAPANDNTVLQAVLALPEQHKTAVYGRNLERPGSGTRRRNDCESNARLYDRADRSRCSTHANFFSLQRNRYSKTLQRLYPQH